MKAFTVFLIALGSLLSGCVAVPVDDGYYGRNPNYQGRDRDGDGVPNRHDRRPDDSRRY
jgi:hypothetical protein